MSDHLDKIKKLLRLSQSANAHEAELAMQRAMELALKHGVDLAPPRSKATMAGWHAGQETNLNRPLSGAAPGAAISQGMLALP